MVHPVKFVARGMLGAVFITGGLLYAATDF